MAGGLSCAASRLGLLEPQTDGAREIPNGIPTSLADLAAAKGSFSAANPAP